VSGLGLGPEATADASKATLIHHRVVNVMLVLGNQGPPSWLQ
jgi:hypothetical protein